MAKLLILAAAATIVPPALAAAPASSDIVVVAQRPHPFDGTPVPDPVLGGMRGGVQLPNGLAVSIGIDIQTRVNGLLVLHTIYVSDGPIVGTRVFTDGTDPVRTAPDTVTVATPGSGGLPTIEVTRTPAGVTIVPGVQASPAAVNLVSGPASTWIMATGQDEVPVVANGPAVAAAPGAISLSTDENGSIVTLDAPMLQIQHLIGQATGISVANTANDQLIDTVSSVNVDLQGASVPLLSSLLGADRLALEIARGR